MNILYEEQATAQGGRNGYVISSDEVLDLQVRLPKSLGGSGGDFTNPEQLFAADYSACLDSALNHIAKLMKLETGETTVTATVGIGQLPSQGFGLEVKIPGLEKDAAQKLLDAAHQACPYASATRGNIDVTLKLVD